MCQALGSVLIFWSEPQIKARRGPDNLCNVNLWLWLAWNSSSSPGWPWICSRPSSSWLPMLGLETESIDVPVSASLWLCEDKSSLHNPKWVHTRQPPTLAFWVSSTMLCACAREPRHPLVLYALSQCPCLVMDKTWPLCELSVVKHSHILQYLELCIQFLPISINTSSQRHREY